MVWKVLLKDLSKSFGNFLLFDHPADFAISLNDNPNILHFDADTDLVEWEQYIFTFIPDSLITVTHHLERVVVDISLCSCKNLSSNCFVPVVLNDAIIFTCGLGWAITESSLYLNVVSSIGGKWWPGLLFLQVSGTNKSTLTQFKFKHLIGWSLWSVVKHKSITNLRKSVFRSQFVRVGFDLIKVKILVISQVVTYLGKACLILKTPFRSLNTKGDFPNRTLQTRLIMLDKAEGAELTELWPNPVFKYSVKNSIPILVAAWMGSVYLSG